MTKRFGIVAASQLPLHYLLAFKHFSLIQYLLGLSHEELNPYHRMLGRILIAFFALHASLYLNFYVQKSLLLKRIRDLDVLLGIFAITSFFLIGTTALAKVRAYSYRLFFLLHVLLSVVILPTLYFHVSHVRIYIIESAFLYAILILQRNLSTKPVAAKLSLLPSTSLIAISLPNLKKRFTPGQHVYLSLPATTSSPFNKLRLNPFTIASVPQDQETCLVVRALSGNTQQLANAAQSSDANPTPLNIEGPYGASSNFLDQVQSCDRILLVAGGVGATFTLPIYRHLRATNTHGSERSKVRFIWSVRGEADAVWGIEQLEEDDTAGKQLPPHCEIYITSPASAQAAPFQRRHTADDGESIELDERNRLLYGDDPQATEPPNPETSTPRTGTSRPLFRRGRPNLSTIADEIFSRSPSGTTAVLVCGPAAMGAELRGAVGRWVRRGRRVFWHAEEFAW